MFGACEDEAAERDRSNCDGTEKWNGGAGDQWAATLPG